MSTEMLAKKEAISKNLMPIYDLKGLMFTHKGINLKENTYMLMISFKFNTQIENLQFIYKKCPHLTAFLMSGVIMLNPYPLLKQNKRTKIGGPHDVFLKSFCSPIPRYVH
jgi:hypothetical protein